MKRFYFAAPLAALVTLSFAANSASAAFHLWQVKEIFSNHDGTVQFIELFDSFANEQFVSGQVLRANSDGVIKNFTIPSNLVVPVGQTSAGKRMLIATTWICRTHRRRDAQLYASRSNRQWPLLQSQRRPTYHHLRGIERCDRI